MEPITVGAFVLLLLFGGFEHHQKEKAQEEVEQLKIELFEADERAEKNAQAAIAAVASSNQNEETANVFSANLDKCVATVEKYKMVEADYKADLISLEENARALADRIDSTNLNQCRVPNWLVDEITKD